MQSQLRQDFTGVKAEIAHGAACFLWRRIVGGRKRISDEKTEQAANNDRQESKLFHTASCYKERTLLISHQLPFKSANRKDANL